MESGQVPLRERDMRDLLALFGVTDEAERRPWWAWRNATAGRGHGTAPVRDAVRIAVEHGFRPNVDFLFGLPTESPADQRASLALAADLADLGARIHAHTFMPLPGTPWRDASPAFIPLETAAGLDRLAQRGASYGHWRKQAAGQHAATSD